MYVIATRLILLIKYGVSTSKSTKIFSLKKAYFSYFKKSTNFISQNTNIYLPKTRIFHPSKTHTSLTPKTNRFQAKTTLSFFQQAHKPSNNNLKARAAAKKQAQHHTAPKKAHNAASKAKARNVAHKKPAQRAAAKKAHTAKGRQAAKVGKGFFKIRIFF